MIILCSIFLSNIILSNCHIKRMYGALTGKSKQMVANEYGEAQLKVSVILLVAIFDVIILARC